MVGEITNMVTGGAKRILADKGYDFDMATPAVVSGRGHTITHKCEGAVIIMPFESDYGRAFIEICFD
ncbi:chemotaxis protein CheX [Photobacterium damselae subsp. damselae CIP 102761]|uniref:Chemotaxis protein CheX n=2 Tax=Photobacterium damselae TaxID=38293 RepID=D0Z0F2_PHODD|nr:chemotaxis protein CheX [Photobacterium damselae subsp. damselae CIP 102761]